MDGMPSLTDHVASSFLSLRLHVLYIRVYLLSEVREPVDQVSHNLLSDPHYVLAVIITGTVLCVRNSLREAMVTLGKN